MAETFGQAADAALSFIFGQDPISREIREEGKKQVQLAIIEHKRQELLAKLEEEGCKTRQKVQRSEARYYRRLHKPNTIQKKDDKQTSVQVALRIYQKNLHAYQTWQKTYEMERDHTKPKNESSITKSTNDEPLKKKKAKPKKKLHSKKKFLRWMIYDV